MASFPAVESQVASQHRASSSVGSSTPRASAADTHALLSTAESTAAALQRPVPQYLPPPTHPLDLAVPHRIQRSASRIPPTMASYAMNLLHSLAHNKSRVDSFDSAGSVDSFDVVSVDESIEECIETEDVEMRKDDDNDAGEWEDLATESNDNDEEEQEFADVHVEMDEGFEDAIGAAVEASIFSGGSGPDEPVKVVTSPRRRSAREALREFYLSRAKASEEDSKNYRTYEPETVEEPVPIAPLRAQVRYDVEVFERAKRLENARKAELALREFYAQRDADKAKRAAENRANERFVYQSQIGSSGFVAPVASTSCVQPMYWETTRFVINSSGPQDAALST